MMSSHLHFGCPSKIIFKITITLISLITNNLKVLYQYLLSVSTNFRSIPIRTSGQYYQYKLSFCFEKNRFSSNIHNIVLLHIASGTLVIRLSFYLSVKVLLLVVLFQQPGSWYWITAAYKGCPSKNSISNKKFYL